MGVGSGISALIMYMIAYNSWSSDEIYKIYHSLWHCFIFTTAGFGALLRFSLDEILYPIMNRRDQLDSI